MVTAVVLTSRQLALHAPLLASRSSARTHAYAAPLPPKFKADLTHIMGEK